jgi:DNA repair exonuclease SbcCD ATPase subunit
LQQLEAMKFALVTFTLHIVCIADASSSIVAAGKDHPIVKVIDLLKSLKEKSIAEGKEEAVAYQKFEYWCSTSTATLKDTIADEKETIDELTDKLAGLTKEKSSLEAEISTLEEQLKDLEASAKAAKEMRDKEADLYAKANADLEDTIKAVEECITALEGAESTTEPKMLLAQRRMKAVLALIGLKVSSAQLKTLSSFAEEPRPELKAKGDYESHIDKYDFKSENVIELLKQLKLKFQDEKLAGTKDETNAINSYELATQARDDSAAAATKSKEKKEKMLASTETDIADADKTMKETQDDLAADSKTLADTEDACATKKSEWETRSKTRTLEIEAMDAAIKILSKSTGVRSEAPENPIPPASPVAFIQSGNRQPADQKMKAVALLRETARSTHSKALERLAVEVQSHLQGPFDAVNNMIEKMIFRLMDEQKKEDEHKNWCDLEIKKTETMKSDKEEKIAELKAEIELQTAKVSALTEEIADANKMISDITAFMKEATEIRTIGKKENALAIKDANEAQKSLTNAIAVIEAFYKESGEIPKEPWEFLQAPAELPAKPATWDSSYTAVADPTKQPGGIITVLENVLSDFEKMEAETKSQDEVDQKEYEETMKANEIEKAGRTQEVEMKTAEKARRVDKIASLSSQKKNTEGQLEKTEQYLVDLKPACVDGDSTYEDRKAARTKEIEALQKSQQILLDAFKEKDEPAGGKGDDSKSPKFLQVKRHVQ